jgi:hypothetical protein
MPRRNSTGRMNSLLTRSQHKVDTVVMSIFCFVTLYSNSLTQSTRNVNTPENTKMFLSLSLVSFSTNKDHLKIWPECNRVLRDSMQERDEAGVASNSPEHTLNSMQSSQPFDAAGRLPKSKEAGEYYWNYVGRVSYPSTANLIDSRRRTGDGDGDVPIQCTCKAHARQPPSAHLKG